MWLILDSKQISINCGLIVPCDNQKSKKAFMRLWCFTWDKCVIEYEKCIIMLMFKKQYEAVLYGVGNE
ncbi:hypothetical protein AGMMS49593_03810 [Endomicrobiia bacterium]|nr:hypothetical protein AGMMS49593_03810 [Endomicrobiia bacterium]